MILESICKRWPWVKNLFTDGAYDRAQLMDKAAFMDFTVEVIKRSARWRHLVRDCEQRIDVAEAMIHLALGRLLLRRLTHP